MVRQKIKNATTFSHVKQAFFRRCSGFLGFPKNKNMHWFVCQQLIPYLFPADLYSLRVTHHAAFKQISKETIYNICNTIILGRLQQNDEHFGTDYHGYFILSRFWLLECLTGLMFTIKHAKYLMQNSVVYEHVRQSFLYYNFNLSFLLQQIVHPDIDCLQLCFYDKQLYVADWNSIIEKKSWISKLWNGNKYGCARSCIRENIPQKMALKQAGFQVFIDKFSFCENCRDYGSLFCTDNLHTVIEYDDDAYNDQCESRDNLNFFEPVEKEMDYDNSRDDECIDAFNFSREQKKRSRTKKNMYQKEKKSTKSTSKWLKQQYVSRFKK